MVQTLLWLLALAKKRWRIVVPIMGILALAWCVRDKIQANARADAFHRVAEMTAKYNTQIEKTRIMERKQSEDSIKKLIDVLASHEKQTDTHTNIARERGRQLWKELGQVQQIKLDSVVDQYEHALASMRAEKDVLNSIILVKNKQALSAVEDLERERQAHALDRLALDAASKARGNATPWKVAAAVATVVAVVTSIKK